MECEYCKKIFKSKIGFKQHNAPKCICAHDHEHKLLSKKFTAMSEVMNYIYQEELDSCMVTVSGKNTKNLKGNSGMLKYMNCRVNRHLSKEQQCPAQLRIAQRDTEHLLYGCLAHSHSFKPTTFLISRQMHDVIRGLLAMGLSARTIKDKHFPTKFDGIHRPISMDDIYNIKKCLPYLDVVDTRKSAEQNVIKFLHWEAVRAFNLSSIGVNKANLPNPINTKEVPCKDGMFLFTMTEVQMKIFARYPSIVLIDGTHGTNQSKFILLSGLVLNSRYEGTPVFQAFISSEARFSIELVIKTFVECTGRTSKFIKTVVTDLAQAFNCISTLLPSAQHVKCSFHVEQAWLRKFGQSSKKILDDLKTLRLQTDVQNFFALWSNLEASYGSSAEYDWIVKFYGEKGISCPFGQWARCFNLGLIPHNLHIERYHRTIKDWELKSNTRMDKALAALMFINKRFADKEYRLLYDLPVCHKYSTFQITCTECHPVEQTQYSVQYKEPHYLVKKMVNEILISETVARNPYTICTAAVCRVLCPKCPVSAGCMHRWICTCKYYALHCVCKHIHLVLMNGSTRNEPVNATPNEDINTEEISEDVVESQEYQDHSGQLEDTRCTEETFKKEELQKSLKIIQSQLSMMSEDVLRFEPEIMEIRKIAGNHSHWKFPKLQTRAVRDSSGVFPKPSRKRKREDKKTLEPGGLKQMLIDALTESPATRPWQVLMTANHDDLISLSTHLDPSEKTKFVKSFLDAKKMYLCECCHVYSIEKIDDGFNICESCHNQVHASCTSNFICIHCVPAQSRT